jgi:hypothetical protein
MATPNTTATMPTRTAFFANQAYIPAATLSPPISPQEVIDAGCPICYLPFSTSEESDHKAVTAGGSCRHIFGKHCLLEWLSTPGANSCAMCRAVVFDEDEVDHWEDGEDYLDSDSDSESEDKDENEEKDENEDEYETEEQIDMRWFLRPMISLEQQRASNEAAERLFAQREAADGRKYHEARKEFFGDEVVDLRARYKESICSHGGRGAS